MERNGFCPDWIVDHFDRYVHPLWQHVELVVVSVAIGFVIAFALALLAHRQRWLVAPIMQITGILYTIPSVAVFFLLLPITGRGFTTALIALVSYTLLIIFRNVITGLDGVPEEARDAGRGMGLTDASCCGASSCRWRCRRSSPGCGSRRRRPSGSPRSRSSPAPAGSATRSSPIACSTPTSSSRAGCACCWRSCSTSLVLAVQRC